MAAVAAVVVKDIRAELPVAIKGGTASKPVWTVGGQEARFVKPLKKNGRSPQDKKVQFGSKKFMAKYKAGTTTSGGDLMFVGLFEKVA
jgi:hypothetical protein